MSSRILVKNLPAYCNQERIKKHFEKTGQITDIKLVKTKDGKSRRFCYIGYKTDEQGLESVKYFNNSFLDTCKLQVETAKTFGEVEDRPWSKYSVGSSSHAALNKEKEVKEELKPKKLNAKQKDFLKDLEDEDPDFKEFLKVMEKRGKKVWGNDDVEVDQSEQMTSVVPLKEEEDVPKSDEDPVPEAEDETKALALDNTISDMDFLKKLKEKSAPEEPEEPQVMNINPARLAILQEVGAVGHEVKTFQTETQIEKEKPVEIEVPRHEEAPSPDLIAETGRIMVRNLAYSCTYEDLQKLFEPFGLIAEIHLPMDKITKESKGFAFVLFVIPENAVVAFTKLDKSIFQGRIIEIVAAKEKPKSAEEMAQPKTFKEKREMEKRKNASNDFNWNSLFMNSDAVADAMAKKLGVKKSELLDADAEDMAVRLALAETNIINETKEYFAENGVSLESFLGSKKSPTVMLIKNIPSSTEEYELNNLFEEYGTLGRVILPPARTIAIIEFPDRNEAKVAFRKLAYKNFKGLPLYLEWAPENIFTEAYDKEKVEQAKQKHKLDNSKKILENEEQDLPPAATVFVKNLNFNTTDEGLFKAFSVMPGLRSAKISTKHNPKMPASRLSMGFGFLEFNSKEEAMNCIKTMQKFILDNHELQLKFSNAAVKQQPVSNRKRQAQDEPEDCTKLLVRNLPFEATRKDLKLLFSSFGAVKTVRLPKKIDGQHRGFGFIDFLTPQEAKNAMKSLGATHLYGRHLVIEWAKEEDTIDEMRAKTAKSFVKDGKRHKAADEDLDDEF